MFLKPRNALFYFILSFSICGNTVLAQHDEEFKGKYSPFVGLEGTAEYEYTYDLDHLEIKSGEFSFKSSESDTSWASINEDHIWSGHYEDNKKSGEWIYNTVRHDVDIIAINDNNLDYRLRTVKSNLNAFYKKGDPTSTWTYSSELTKKGGEPAFYEKISVSFEKGLVHGDFLFEYVTDEGIRGSVSGKCDKGLFVGEWTFKYGAEGEVITEERNYTNGILLDLEKGNDIETFQQIKFPLSVQTQELVDENKTKGHLVNRPFSFDFNDGYYTRSFYLRAQKDGNEILQYLENLLLRFDPNWKKKKHHIFGANRGVYPLSKEEEKAVTDWYAQELKFHLLVDEIKETEVRDFSFSKDSVALIVLKWIEKQEYIFSALTSDELLSKEIEYLNRSEILLNRVLNTLQTDTLVLTNKTVIVDYPVPEESKREIFSFLFENYKARIKAGEKLNEELSHTTKTLTLEEELKKLPLRIKQEQGRLDSLLKNQSKNTLIDDFLTHIDQYFLKDHITSQYQRFVTTANKKKKKSIGDSILVNLNSVKSIYDKSILIAKRSEYIDSLYTEYVFDAFTFSDNVPSRYKKRLYDQVIKASEELIKLASESETPSQCLEYINEISELQAILIYLHDKKTKDLEKALQRAKTLDERLKLFHEIL